jgi:glycosyltransferase involved in cell wall biosynthesis
VIRFSLISGVCMLPDAISYSVVCKIQALRLLYGEDFEYRVFSYASNLQDRNSLVVSGVAELAMHPFFANSDVVCYEFGIFYELVNSVFLLPARTKKLAIYHNITPEHLVAREDQRVSVRCGLQQKANLFFCDHVAADSAYNRDDLIQYGLPQSKVDVLELPLDDRYNSFPPPVRPVIDFVEVLFVGRFVASKGVLDLVKAIAKLVTRNHCKLRLSLVGDVTFSDPSYIKEVNEVIADSNFPASFRFLGGVSSQDLVRYYHESHIFAMPSYHEGYCLPVLEAMSCGCLVVAYDAANLPYITAGLGRLVSTGDIEGLADAIGDLAHSLLRHDRDHDKCEIPLDCGTQTITQYQAAATKYLSRFTAAKFTEAFGGIMSQRIGLSRN